MSDNDESTDPEPNAQGTGISGDGVQDGVEQVPEPRYMTREELDNYMEERERNRNSPPPVTEKEQVSNLPNDGPSGEGSGVSPSPEPEKIPVPSQADPPPTEPQEEQAIVRRWSLQRGARVKDNANKQQQQKTDKR